MFRRGRSEEPELAGQRTPIQLQLNPDHAYVRARSVGPRPTRAMFGDSENDTGGPSDSSVALRPPPKYGERPMHPSDSESRTGTHNMASLNRHVDPQVEFPSLKRGFTMYGGGQYRAELASSSAQNDLITDQGDSCSYYFWVVMFFIFIVSLLNLIANIVIFKVYNLTPTFGINFMEFVPEENLIKFVGDNHVLESINVQSGIITGFNDEPLVISADNGGDIVLVVDPEGNPNEGIRDEATQLRISPKKIEARNIEEFQVIHPKTGEILFDINDLELNIEGPVESLEADEIIVDRIMSPLDEDLVVRSDSFLNLESAEGINMEAKNINFDSAKDINIQADEDIVLDGDITIDPRALPVGGGGYPNEEGQFKLCICMPSGLLFRVPVHTLPDNVSGPRLPPVSCHDVELWEENPCEES